MVIEDEVQERNLTPEAVNADDARLALVPSSSPPSLRLLLQDTSTSSPEVRALLGVATVGTFFVKILLLLHPCSPYTCSAMVLWPLLAFAV